MNVERGFHRMSVLILKHIRAELEHHELLELEHWIKEKEEHRLLFLQLTNRRLMQEGRMKISRARYIHGWRQLEQKLPGLALPALFTKGRQKSRSGEGANNAVLYVIKAACFVWLVVYPLLPPTGYRHVINREAAFLKANNITMPEAVESTCRHLFGDVTDSCHYKYAK